MAEVSNIHLTAGLAAFQGADYETAVKELEEATRQGAFLPSAGATGDNLNDTTALPAEFTLLPDSSRPRSARSWIRAWWMDPSTSC